MMESDRVGIREVYDGAMAYEINMRSHWEKGGSDHSGLINMTCVALRFRLEPVALPEERYIKDPKEKDLRLDAFA
jgi:hypothetical protein